MAVSKKAIMTMSLVCGLLDIAAAKVYNVGGHRGWTFQSENSNFYDNQFKNVTLIAGVDYLNFTFTDGVHNVIAVHESYLAKCDCNDPLNFNISDSPAAITALVPGSWGFICGVGDHCRKFGMHMNITFVSGDSPDASPGSESLSTASVEQRPVSHGGENWALVDPSGSTTIYALDTAGLHLHNPVAEHHSNKP